MKKTLALAVLLSFSTYMQGQGFMVNIGVGYAFRCSFDAYHDTANSYTASIKEGLKYSLDLGYKVDRNFSANLALQYQSTIIRGDVRFNATNLSPALRVALLWIQAGGTSFFPAGNFELFFGTYIGLGTYHFKDLPPSGKNDPIRFAWSVKGGLGYFINKRIGLNIRADALFSTDPLTEQFATPGLSSGKAGFNGISQLGLTGGITILLFREAEQPVR